MSKTSRASSIRWSARLVLAALTLILMGSCSQGANDVSDSSGASNASSNQSVLLSVGSDSRGTCYQGALIQHGMFSVGTFQQIASENRLTYSGNARAALDGWPATAFKDAAGEIMSCQKLPP